MRSHGHWYIEVDLGRFVRALINCAACIAIGFGLGLLHGR